MRSVIAVVLLLGAVDAQAKCAAPGAYFLPKPGTALPLNPTVFLIEPPAAYPKLALEPKLTVLTETNAPLDFTVSEERTMGGMRVLRIDVKAPVGTRFAIEGARVPAAWMVESLPPAGPFTLRRGKDVHSSWTCSYESSRVLDSSLDAPAYRIEYAETEADLRAGKSLAVVVEGRTEGFRSSGERPAVPPAVRLGHHNCWGANFEWTTSRLVVRVTALLPDGSERTADQLFALDAVPGWSGK